MAKVDLFITGRERDLGGFSIRRILPYATHRMVGPFIFFDHMGPALFHLNEGMDVRPHPHIGLATVTYLFEGKIHHRDSLGSDQLIEPGAVNWMTAGRGIVHSERTPNDLRKAGGFMNGIQCWVALPEEHEETEPSFTHYKSQVLPEFSLDGVQLKLLVGSALGYSSPVKTHSDLFYLEAKLPNGTRLNFPIEGNRESAVYLVEGSIRVGGQDVKPYTMAVAPAGGDLEIEAVESARVMILGGSPVGQRFIYWNFVASSEEKIETAKKEWLSGPKDGDARFKKIPGDDKEFIPLPDEPRPKGTPM